jgi:hypothetical protein
VHHIRGLDWDDDLWEEITMENLCNNCIHKDVCSRWTATWGMKSCEHYREERKGKWLLEAHNERVNYRWNVAAECSRCHAEKKEIYAGFFPGFPDNLAEQVILDSAQSVRLNNFCPNCGADMRGTEDG